MKLLWTIIVIAISLTIGMLFFWRHSLKSSAAILEFNHPSLDIIHSIEKRVFIDSLDIIDSDTIRIREFGHVDILPTSSWIEKKTFWKSGSLELDSLDSYSDTVILIVNFKDFVNGQMRKPNNSGYYIIKFTNSSGDKESVYMDDNKVQLTFTMHVGQISDTTSLLTDDGQRIILRKRI